MDDAEPLPVPKTELFSSAVRMDESFPDRVESSDVRDAV